MHESYTERQKKHHFSRATLTKTHHIWKMQWNCKRSFLQNHRNCSLRTTRKGRLFRTFNSYSLNFNGGLCNRPSGFRLCQTLWSGGEQFLWFLKNDLLWFHCMLLLFDSSKHLFFEMCLVRSTLTILYPIMSHFSALDFGECRSEEVVSLFWRSVYIVWEYASLIQQIKSLLIMIALCRWKRKANAGIKVSSSSTTWWIKDGCDQTSSLFRTFSQTQQQRRRVKKKNEQAGEHRCFQTLKEERVVALAHKTKRREAAKR